MANEDLNDSKEHYCYLGHKQNSMFLDAGIDNAQMCRKQ